MSLKVVVVHNHYREPGGEDAVFAAEAGLLEGHGHQVQRYTVHNDQVAAMGRAALALRTVWNGETYRGLRRLFRHHRADLVHFHNTLPLISPAAYHAAKSEGVAVVQTLHNYRPLCANGLFFRDGHACEDCLGRAILWPALLHRCYRGSRPASATVAAMVAVHEALGTWTRMVDVYIALTEFARGKFVQGGLPQERLVVKPNFVDPEPEPGDGRGGYAVFVGRLSVEKGLGTLLSAWEGVGARLPLKLIGDGREAHLVADAMRRIPGIEWLGRRSIPEAHALMRHATFLVLPSECYETYGRVAVEAFASGTPVIGAGHGAIAEVVIPNQTGLHFTPGDAGDLAAKVRWAVQHPEEMREMGLNARRVYEEKYTPEVNYRRLMVIYERAIENNRRSRND